MRANTSNLCGNIRATCSLQNICAEISVCRGVVLLS